MIVSCPACAARMRLDRQRFAGKRVTLRCARCSEVFQTEIINEQPQEQSVAVAQSHPMVLVAHSDEALCRAVGDVLTSHAIQWASCHDGIDALRMMDASPPQVALVDVALPGLFAFEVVEKVRQRPGLANVRIILLSSVYNKMAYKRTPSSLYGADDYIEKHHIPSDLADKIKRLVTNHCTVPKSPQPLPPTGEDIKRFNEVNTRLKQAEESEVDISKTDPSALEKALRLARIIVSDIALYNQERVEEGIRSGQFFSLLETEIAEGNRLFQQRVPADLPGRDDILHQTFQNFIERRKHETNM